MVTEKKAANAEDNEGYTPLHWATQSKSNKLVPYAYSWNTELMSRGKQERIVTHHLIYKPRSGVIVRKVWWKCFIIEKVQCTVKRAGRPRIYSTSLGNDC